MGTLKKFKFRSDLELKINEDYEKVSSNDHVITRRLRWYGHVRRKEDVEVSETIQVILDIQQVYVPLYCTHIQSCHYTKAYVNGT